MRVFVGIGIFLAAVAVSIGAWMAIQMGTPHASCSGCNVFVISLDQVRADSLPCFGYTKETMPNLCRFAARSQVFSKAYATASRTLDAHFSMITGLYPSHHGMNIPYASQLSRSIPTLAERMKQSGYRTYFMGPKGDPHLPLERGLGRGFDKTFEADEPALWIKAMDTIATGSGTRTGKTFYFFHTYHAHEPFIPSTDDLKRFYSGPISVPISYDGLCQYTADRLMALHPDPLFTDPKLNACEKIGKYSDTYTKTLAEFDDTYTIFNSRYWRLFDGLQFSDKQQYVHALYSGQLYSLDRELGKFFVYLQSKGLLENSMVVIVGDQGDEFGEHGDWSHGWSLYTEVIHIPFIVYIPNQQPKRYEKLASEVDIFPTVLRAIGQKISTRIDGIDLLSDAVHRFVIAEHVSDSGVSLRTDRYTVIRRTTGSQSDWELYDRSKDPGEHTNIYESNQKTAQGLMSLYDKESASGSGTPDLLPLPTWINEENRKRLIESGYF